MSNYNNSNLIPVDPATLCPGDLAIKFNGVVFAFPKGETGDEGSGGEGGGGGDQQTILYMPMNGNLDIYGNLRSTSCICEEYNEEDWATSDWNPTFSDDGVFSGEKCFVLEKTVVSEEDWYPPSFKTVWLPTNDNFLRDDFTVDVWIQNPPQREETTGCGINVSYSLRLNLTHDSSGKWLTSFSHNYKFEGLSYSYQYTVTVNDTWSHIALVKKDSTLYYFFNGVLLQRFDNVTVNDSDTGHRPFRDRRGQIGSLTEETEIKAAHLRILNYALWTENFTPPTQGSYEQNMN